jgi:hypothetical protein
MNRSNVQPKDTIGVVLRDPGGELGKEIKQALDHDGVPVVMTHRNDHRPAHCFLCERRMYYEGDERHVPEYLVTLEKHHKLYVHQDCWEAMRKAVSNVKWPEVPQ